VVASVDQDEGWCRWVPRYEEGSPKAGPPTCQPLALQQVLALALALAQQQLGQSPASKVRSMLQALRGLALALAR